METKNEFRLLVLFINCLICLLFLQSSIVQAQSLCRDVFSMDLKFNRYSESQLLNTDLMQLQRFDTFGKSESVINLMNINEIRNLENSKIEKTSRRKFLTLKEIDQLQKSVRENKVTSDFFNYEQPGTSIGYCFGRAMYYHVKLLKNKVDKSVIRKAFVVGPMRAYGVNWQFHVATIVRGPKNTWYALDNNFSRPQELSVWYKTHFQMGTYKNVRLFITDPKKFTISARYDRVQLGLALERSQDWYRGYFTDLMETFRDENKKQED